MNVYPFIEAEKKQQGNVARACHLLKVVSRSAYYHHRKHGPSTRAKQDIQLTAAIAEVDQQSGHLQCPPVHAELKDPGGGGTPESASPG